MISPAVSIGHADARDGLYFRGVAAAGYKQSCTQMGRRVRIDSAMSCGPFSMPRRRYFSILAAYPQSPSLLGIAAARYFRRRVRYPMRDLFDVLIAFIALRCWMRRACLHSRDMTDTSAARRQI